MMRMIVAILVTSFAAPAIVILLSLPVHIILGGKLGAYVPNDLAMFIANTLAISSFMMILVIPASIVTASIINHLQGNQKLNSILGGIVQGLFFVILLTFLSWVFDFTVNWLKLCLTVIVAGAVCGWIYWRIALYERYDAVSVQQDAS